MPRALLVLFDLFILLQELGGVFSAREMVWWYNGHPEYRHLPINLSSTDTAVIFGLVRPRIVFMLCPQIRLLFGGQLVRTAWHIGTREAPGEYNDHLRRLRRFFLPL